MLIPNRRRLLSAAFLILCARALPAVGEGGEPMTARGVPAFEAFTLDGIEARRRAADTSYIAFLDVPGMRAGLYRLAAGEPDLQTPHAADEVYHVVAGRAVLEVADRRVAVAPGSVVFVGAGVRHRFVDVAEDLSVLVVFGPRHEGPAGPD